MLCPSLLLVILILAPDFITSESEGEHPELIFSDRENLVRIDLETPDKWSVIVDGQSNAVAVDYDLERKLVFWSDVQTKGIYSSDIETGEQRKVIAKDGIVTPDGLAVDWIHGNIYWTDTGTNTISVASLDGNMRKLLFGADLDEPRAIVVNPSEGWMFWTDWGANAKIERSGMDGTHRSTIVSKDIAVPNGLAIDFETRRLFWADVTQHTLRSSDYDGSNVEIVLTSFLNLRHPFAVDVFQDWLYWTDWRSHSVSKVNKVTGQNIVKVSTRTHFFPMGLRVYHSQKQPKGTRYCGEKNAECLYLCLPTPKGTSGTKNFTCACPDGKDCSDIDTVTGTTTATESLTATPSKLQSYSIDKILHDIHEDVNYCGRFAGIIFGTFVFLIIVISLVGFYIYKQILKGRIASLSFVNPVFRKQTADQVKLDGDQSHSNLI